VVALLPARLVQDGEPRRRNRFGSHRHGRRPGQLEAYNAQDLDAFVAAYANDVVVVRGGRVELP